MFLVFRKRLLEPDIFFAFCSFIAGSIFFIGLLQDLFLGSLKNAIENLGKITIQSNLFAFIISGIYFFNPKHKIFRTNLYLLAAITLLFFAGLGFWCLLFPIYYIDLNSFIISPEEKVGGFRGAFYAIWNHTITQIFFLVFFYHINKKRNLWHLIPSPTKQINKFVLTYCCIWQLWNVFASTVLVIFPNYGVLTNFNPNSFYADDSIATIFNLKILIFSNFFCLFLGLGISTFFSRFAIKFRSIHRYELTEYESNIAA